MSKHTPKWSADVGDKSATIHETDTGRLVATVIIGGAAGYDYRAAREVHLIAAAPVLLEALRAVMATPVPHAVGCSHWPETCSCHRAMALAAIAKAEGRDR